MNAPPPPRRSRYPEDASAPFRLAWGNAHYPAELGELEKPPSLLWARGNPGVLGVQTRVAIVGTRAATEYGLRVARELGAAFARAGACVVSGMARGIDAAAHRAVLDADGITVGVLGTGIQQVFPTSHRELHERVAATGLLLTELEPDDHGMPFTFLERNRIIAALCRLIIVVEAPARSGAINTAEWALGLGRDIAAVPGRIDQPQSAGTNQLIASGAHIIATVEDAIMLAGLTAPPKVPRGDPDGDEGRVWKALERGALDIDTLCQRSGLPTERCLAAVTQLELAGSVECALSGAIRRR